MLQQSRDGVSVRLVSRVGRGSQSVMEIHQVAPLVRVFMALVSLDEEANCDMADGYDGRMRLRSQQ
jgi:hypothetical protein